jgi:hypothetical protein
VALVIAAGLLYAMIAVPVLFLVIHIADGGHAAARGLVRGAGAGCPRGADRRAGC